MAQIKGYASPTRGPVTADTLGFNGTTSLIEREVGSEIFYLDPDVSPYTLLSDAQSSETTDAPKYEWYEKSLRPKTTTLNAAGSNVDASATTTNNTLVVNDADVLQVGDLVLDLNTSEIFLVSARTNTTSYTVIRAAAGSTASASNADADALTVIGSAFSEGVDVPPTDEWQEVQKYNFVQIFRRSFGGSASREATATYFGRGFRDKLAREKSKEFAMDVERAFIAGTRSETQGDAGTLGVGTAAVGTGVIRTTGGFLSVATSNVLDLAGAALTEPNLEAFLESVFAHTASGDSRTVMAGTSLVTAFDMLAVDKIRTVSDSSLTYGIAVKEWQTSHGRLLIVKHRILSDLGTAYARGALIVDAKRLGTRTLAGRATKLMKNRQGPGVDGWVDEYIAEMGAQCRNPEVHGVIKNAALAA
jgi:hypothetical protein